MASDTPYILQEEKDRQTDTELLLGEGGQPVVVPVSISDPLPYPETLITHGQDSWVPHSPVGRVTVG